MIYAPPFPQYDNVPGFWDDAFCGDVRIPRLFAILVCDESSQPVNRVEWRRSVSRAGRFTVHVKNTSTADLKLFVWSLPTYDPALSTVPWQSVVGLDETGFVLANAWPAESTPDRSGVEMETLRCSSQNELPIEIRVDLEYASLAIRSWTMLAQRHDTMPEWRSSLVPLIAADPNFESNFTLASQLVDIANSDLLHILHEIPLAAGQEKEISARMSIVGASLSPIALSIADRTINSPTVARAVENRVRGLQLNTIAAGLPVCRSAERFDAYVAEGIGFFRNFVTYSAQAHVREAAWLESPDLGLAILRNLGRIQAPNGSFPGHSYSSRPARDFYHSEFISGIERMVENHGIDAHEFRPVMQKYLNWLIEDRLIDFGGPAMIAVCDQNETGQEYMSRYLFANSQADKWESFRVGGADATCYGYAIAKWLSDPIAERLESGIVEVAYDADARWYCDVLPSGERSPARPATGFYPYLYLPLDRLDIGAIPLHASDFLLAKGIAADSVKDPRFSSVGIWGGKRLNCPWNGRSWPMASCHVVDAWFRASEADSSLLPLATEAFEKTISIMEWQGQPTSYEHYDPITGLPSLYRGYDDYMHSWILDLCMRHGARREPKVS